MILTLLTAITLFAANAPLTGDEFPAKLLIIIVAALAVVAILLAVLGKKKDDKDKK